MTAPTELYKRRCFWAGFALMGLAGVAGLSRIISIAIDKVASGKGLETYRTVWLVEFNYVGVLVLFATVLLALLVGGGMWLYDWWQWRSLKKKYGDRNGNT
jgi:hypothetical protein